MSKLRSIRRKLKPPLPLTPGGVCFVDEYLRDKNGNEYYGQENISKYLRKKFNALQKAPTTSKS